MEVFVLERVDCTSNILNLDQNYLVRNTITFFCACSGTVRTCVTELRTNSEILSEILIMTRKSNSNPSAKSLQEENEALKKEIESLKSEFKRIPAETHKGLNNPLWVSDSS